MSKLETECNFCGIVTGKTPTELFLKNRWVHAFFAKEPTRLGHSIILWNKHVANACDIPLLGFLIFNYIERLVQISLIEEISQPIARIVELKSGFFINHYHRHVYPMSDSEPWESAEDAFRNRNIPLYSQEERSELLLKLRHRFHYDPKKHC